MTRELAEDPGLRRRRAAADRRGVRQRPRPDRARTSRSTTRASRSSPTSRTRSPAPTWRSSSYDNSTASAPAVQGDVQGRQVGHPVAPQLPGRRQGPPGQDRRRRHGPDQGHDPLRPRRGPRGARRARPARRQGHRLKGRGKRVTLRDKSEKVLADFIIGNEVARPARPALRPRPGPEADLRRQRQGRPLDPVRRLDRDEPAEGRRRRTSARSSSTTTRSTPSSGRIIPGEILTIDRKDDAAPWTFEGDDPRRLRS